jgi:Eukaryotic initiation factor 4E
MLLCTCFFLICFIYKLLAMIGEQFEYGDEICGAVVSVRGKQERVAIWTKNASNEAAQVFNQLPLKLHGQH